MIEIRPLTRADIVAFNREGTGRTVRGYAVEKDGELAGIAGVTIQPGHAEAFSDMKPGIDAPKLTVWRCSLRLVEKIKATGLPVIAISNPNLPGAGKFLERLGFHYVSETTDGKVYSL